MPANCWATAGLADRRPPAVHAPLQQRRPLAGRPAAGPHGGGNVARARRGLRALLGLLERPERADLRREPGHASPRQRADRRLCRAGAKRAALAVRTWGDEATCFWLKNLLPLVATNIVAGREPRVHHASPSPNRWKEGSRFFPGITRQWLTSGETMPSNAWQRKKGGLRANRM
jgi:hypothetical protein